MHISSKIHHSPRTTHEYCSWPVLLTSVLSRDVQFILVPVELNVIAVVTPISKIYRQRLKDSLPVSAVTVVQHICANGAKLHHIQFGSLEIMGF